ncbi:hypothetical protein GW17_00026065 [Ensete ventricosum]|nr:hypothetical protein GW17_00026065 [Ensete ventricosum]
MWWRCTPPAQAAASRAGDAASHGRCPCWRSLLPAVALVGYSLGRGATPCDLAVGSATYGLATGGCPLRAARSCSNLISQLLRRGREENRRWWLKLEEGEGSGSAARAATTGEGGGCGISMRSAQRWLQLRAREAVATAALADGRSRGDGAATEATLVGGRSRGDGAIAKVLATDEGGEEDSAEGVRLERRRR